MERQTDILKDSVVHAKTSADAALLNAQAVINSQRARIVIERSASFGDMTDDQEMILQYEIIALNIGKTGAEIISSCLHTTTVDESNDLPTEPEYRPTIIKNPVWLRPKKRWKFDAGCTLKKMEWRQLNAEGKIKVFYGQVIYR